MAMNDLSVNQVYQIVNAIVNDVKGGNQTAPVDTAGFVAQATTALKTGYDPVIQSISQIMHKTIFSDRAYRPIFTLPNWLSSSNMWYLQAYGCFILVILPILKLFD